MKCDGRGERGVMKMEGVRGGVKVFSAAEQSWQQYKQPRSRLLPGEYSQERTLPKSTPFLGDRSQERGAPGQNLLGRVS